MHLSKLKLNLYSWARYEKISETYSAIATTHVIVPAPPVLYVRYFIYIVPLAQSRDRLPSLIDDSIFNKGLATAIGPFKLGELAIFVLTPSRLCAVTYATYGKIVVAKADQIGVAIMAT